MTKTVIREAKTDREMFLRVEKLMNLMEKAMPDNADVLDVAAALMTKTAYMLAYLIDSGIVDDDNRATFVADSVAQIAETANRTIKRIAN